MKSNEKEQECKKNCLQDNLETKFLEKYGKYESDFSTLQKLANLVNLANKTQYM